MTTKLYIFDGAVATGAAAAMGAVVDASTKRIITSAALVNTTAAPIPATVSLGVAASTGNTLISARPIAAGETYLCPELIGRHWAMMLCHVEDPSLVGPMIADARGRDVVARLKITQTKSGIGYKRNQKETLRSLGLKRMHDTVVKEDRPEIRGLVAAMTHPITIEEG